VPSRINVGSFFYHPLSWIGAGLATISAVCFLTVFGMDLFGFHTNPYIGIVFFLVLPSFFVLGLLLIPVGAWLHRRRVARGRPAATWPRIDFNEPSVRRTAVIIMAATIANLTIISLAAYRGIEYMDSVEFCGQVCHEVMEPEFAAYEAGPHARVTCVQCHIGPGAPWFVRSKLSGTRQVFAVLLNSHTRPIPSPVENLRPARDTCEQCHWPEKFHGDKVEVRKEYGDDEANSESVTTLRIHVGGGSELLGVASGIHWHMNVANVVEYIATDEKRQVIPYVRLRDRAGNVTEYLAEGVTPEQLQQGERRTMDCMDCHNRPSHPFAPSAERAVDGALALGSVPRTLPFVRREMVAAIKKEYPDQDAAASGIESHLRAFYTKEATKAPPADVARAIAQANALYRRNVFPTMKVGWGTYPNNIGHMAFPGCFRCHDDSHKSKDGKAIRQDCDLCHTIE
jgi:hypothetical protein